MRLLVPASSIEPLVGELDGRITKQLVKTRSGEFDIESVHSLIFRNQGVSDLGCIGECVNLERLDLSENLMTKLYALASLTNLTYLNLADNKIVSLEGLQALDNLQYLNLSGNIIRSLEELCCITGLEKLSELRLIDEGKGRSNPVSSTANYKQEIMKMFPGLLTLDGQRVKGPGSDLFHACEKLDKILEECIGLRQRSSIDTHPSPWIPEGFWDRLPERRTIKSGFDDADEQVQALLDSCHKLSDEASTILESYASDQHNTLPS